MDNKMKEKKVAFLKVVNSSRHLDQKSLRGPLGRGHNDDALKHITAAQFEDGDDVVLITKDEYDTLRHKAFWYDQLD